jgi:hypothetical protein
LVWDSKSYEAGATAAMKTREVLRTSQGCHVCNQTDQQPEVTHPGIRFLPVSLMKMNIFRVGQVSGSKHHPLRDGHGSLALRKV